MRLLLDTHSIIWLMDDPSQLSASANAVATDPANDRLVSAATIWELSIEVGQGNLTLFTCRMHPYQHVFGRHWACRGETMTGQPETYPSPLPSREGGEEV